MGTTNLRANPPVNKIFANKFKLILPQVDLVQDLFEKYAKNYIEMTVKGTVASGLEVSAIDTPVVGHKPIKVTGAGYSYKEITVSFIIDGDFVNYYILWTWLNRIYNLATGKAPVLDDGQNPYVNFAIVGMDNYNNVIVNFKYNGGFITSISDVEVSYDNSDRLEAQVSLAYDDYTIELPNNNI